MSFDEQYQKHRDALLSQMIANSVHMTVTWSGRHAGSGDVLSKDLVLVIGFSDEKYSSTLYENIIWKIGENEYKIVKDSEKHTQFGFYNVLNITNGTFEMTNPTTRLHVYPELCTPTTPLF